MLWGKTIRLHPETELCSNFEEAKLFVEADMTKALPKVYHFTSKYGINAQVEILYPLLPSRCSECFKWGHLPKDCKTQSSNLYKRAEADTKGTSMETEPMEVSQIQENQKASEEVEMISTENPTSEIEEKSQELDTSWSTISPGKASRISENRLELKDVPISPSRFAILTEEET